MIKSEMRIEIKIKSHLGKEWRAWFNNLDITHEGNHTIISGEIADDAALHGIINQIMDLHLKLISVKRLETDNPK